MMGTLDSAIQATNEQPKLLVQTQLGLFLCGRILVWPGNNLFQCIGEYLVLEILGFLYLLTL